MISRTTPDEFVEEPSVRKFLGSTKTLKALDDDIDLDWEEWEGLANKVV